MKKYLNSKSSPAEIIIMLIFAFGLMFFATASSPHYGINPWVDANAFFTVGKSMANGVTIYKDLFEQKGPLLYVLHAIAYFISKTSFTGVYLLESAAMFFSMFFAYKTARLYLGKPLSLGCAVLFAASAVNSTCFYMGDSAEEFALPLLMVLIYYTAYYFKNSDENKLKWYVFLLNGFFAGCVLMIKFTVIGFWFGFMAVMSAHTLFVKKDVKSAFKNAFIFVGGMLIPLAAFSLYFMIKGGLKDFYEAYFGFNLFVYSDEKSLIEKATTMALCFVNAFFKNKILFVLTGFGCLAAIFVKPVAEKNIVSKLAIPVIYACGALFTYMGGKNFAYYFFSFTGFTLFAFIAMGLAAEKLNKKDVLGICFAAASVICAFAVTLTMNIAVLNAPKSKEETIQYKISEAVNSKDKNASVLCYKSLDAGIYLFDDIVPEFRYFEKQNIEYEVYPENMDEQNRYIKEHLTDFVVCRLYSPDTEGDYLKKVYEENEALKNDYTLIMNDKSYIADDSRRGGQLEQVYLLFELNK